jgi:hypothetical protein
MGRRPEEKELRDSEAQHVVHHRGARRQGRVEAMRDEGVDLAEPAQHRRDEEAREGAVTGRQSCHLGVVFDRVVERPSAAQNRANQIDRHATR